MEASKKGPAEHGNPKTDHRTRSLGGWCGDVPNQQQWQGVCHMAKGKSEIKHSARTVPSRVAAGQR